MNSVIFENKIKVLIHGPNIQLENADVDFSAEFNDEKEPNTCTVRIYNLNEKNMDAVLNNTKYVEIFTNQYGLKDDDGKILWQNAFSGTLREAIKKPKQTFTKKGKPRKTKKKIKYLTPSITTGDDEADSYIELSLQEGNGSDIGTFVSKSYRSGFSTKKILTDISKEIGLEIVFDKNVKNFIVNYPIVLHGNARDSLTKISKYIGCSCTIENNRAYIVSDNPAGSTCYYQFDEDNIQQPKYLQDKKIELVATYMSNLHVGTFIRIVNKKMEIDDLYQICKLEHKFSNNTEDCETTITVKY